MSLPVTEIPYHRLDYKSETEKLSIITRVVIASSLDPENMLYTGIEGREVEQYGILPHRVKTFGFTFEQYKESADELDRYGSMGTPSTPLEYALERSHTQPALLLHDMAYLTQHELEYQVWIPKAGKSLADAARLLILISF